MKKLLYEIFHWLLLGGSALAVCLALGLILLSIFVQGWSALSIDFLFQYPSAGMTRGGILPAIAGTLVLTLVTALFAVPFGVACAVYLQEYARPSVLTSVIRSAIRNLAGVPSIIYGLFGLALFVQGLQLGTSVLSAGLTLGLLSLPYIITTAEEALKAVPRGQHEAALALGATEWETIRDVSLPTALPGILTGVILALSRSAGETAPILFTGVAFYTTGTGAGLRQEFMALPYHLYMLSTQHQSITQVRPLAYGTATVLILLILCLNATAFYIRARYGRR